jgi:hypothetical protein
LGCLSALQQNGGMGTEYDSKLETDATEKITNILADIKFSTSGAIILSKYPFSSSLLKSYGAN